MAKLMEFYRLRRDEIYAMSFQEREDLWEAITIIESERALLAINVAGYPYMSADAKTAFHKGLHVKAYPGTYEKPVVMTTEQMAALLSGGR